MTVQINGRSFKVEIRGEAKSGGKEIHLFGERGAHYRTMAFDNEKNTYFLIDPENFNVDPLGKVAIIYKNEEIKTFQYQ